MQPIMIIGAGRSGTNMLRDALTTFPDFGTWPCDEINYIWRYGNAQHPNDELQPAQATPKTQKYIRKAFTNIAKQQNVSHVVEKTCANSLRVPFVDTIFPEAKYIFIVRDGRDVIASAMLRWSAELNIPYILKKAWYVPLADIPYYSSRYISNRIYRLTSNEERLAFWGPRFVGMEEALKNKTLAGVCALQWQACVQKTAAYLQTLPQERTYQIKYEEFVQNPFEELGKLSYFLGVDVSSDIIQTTTKNITTRSIGKWEKHLSTQQLEDSLPILQETLAEYGYNLHASTTNGSL